MCITFCTISRNPDEHRELPLHLFYSCLSTETVLNSYFSFILNENIVITRQELFVGFTKYTNEKNDLLFYITKLFLKFIWDCKVRKILPNLESCKGFISSEIQCMKRLNKDIEILVENSGILFNQPL